MARLQDFSGDKSTVLNTLTQNAFVNQQFDVDLLVAGAVLTNGDELGAEFQQSRFREIKGDFNDLTAEANFASGQRQGHAQNPVQQIANSDGGTVNNVLTQSGTIQQTGNDVNLEGGFTFGGNLTGPLSPRNANLTFMLNRNAANNASSASQEQHILQSSAGGVGSKTENDGSSSNVGVSSLSNDESTSVTNSISAQFVHKDVLTLSGSSLTGGSAGATVGTLSAPGSMIGTPTFTIVSDPTGKFEIVVMSPAQLKLKNSESLTVSDVPGGTVTVTVRATDEAGLTFDQDFVINVDFGAAPTDIALSNNIVDEESAGATVGALSATDATPGETFTFSIQTDADDLFEVSGTTLKLQDGKSADFETKTSHQVTVRVTDSVGNTFDEAFTINITDKGVASTAISLSSSSVIEESAGATVGTLSATDADPVDTFTFTLQNDPDNLFEVSGTTFKLQDGKQTDFETKTSHDVQFRVTDSFGFIFDQTISISVTDTNEALASVDDLDGSNGFASTGLDADDRFGFDVASAGDVNGDGFEDFIVGASRGDDNGTNSGESYLFFGKSGGFSSVLDPSTLNGANGFRIDGINNYDRAGIVLGAGGDVNGDGFDDILIGATGADPNGSGTGQAYIIFGKSGGFGSELDLSSLDGNNGFRLDAVGGANVNIAPMALDASGDVNGDGFDDILVGTNQADIGKSNNGQSYVVFGKPSGFGSAIQLSALDGTTGFKMTGIDQSDYSGTSASFVDLNGDGFDDIFLGARSGDGGGLNGGEGYVVFGKSGGFSSDIQLSSLNGTNGFQINSQGAGDFFGQEASSAGDVNGDGFEDLIVGAYNFGSGRTYVIFGKSSGFTDPLNVTSLDGTNGFRINFETSGDELGLGISSADFNADGFDDLIMSTRGDRPGFGNQDEAGEYYILFGKSSGFGSSFDLSDVEQDSGLIVVGANAGDTDGQFNNYGLEVSSAGDVNGDGFDDFVIGVPYADPNGTSSGSSYIIFGRGSSTNTPTSGNDTVTGTAAAEKLLGAQGNDSITGGGGATCSKAARVMTPSSCPT